MYEVSVLFLRLSGSHGWTATGRGSIKEMISLVSLQEAPSKGQGDKKGDGTGVVCRIRIRINKSADLQKPINLNTSKNLAKDNPELLG